MNRFMPMNYSGAWNPEPIKKDHKTKIEIEYIKHYLILTFEDGHKEVCNTGRELIYSIMSKKPKEPK